MAGVIALDLAILGGKITKIRPFNSSRLPNEQCMHIIQHKFDLLDESCNLMYLLQIRIIFMRLFEPFLSHFIMLNVCS